MGMVVNAIVVVNAHVVAIAMAVSGTALGEAARVDNRDAAHGHLYPVMHVRGSKE